MTEQSPCLSGSASGLAPLSTLMVTTSRHGSSQPDPTFKTSSSSRTARHCAIDVVAPLCRLRRCQKRHVNIVVRDAIIMLTPVSWQHHDIMNSFRFSQARLCQYKLFPGIISKASQSSYKSILF
jgi:hypothetical protein